MALTTVPLSVKDITSIKFKDGASPALEFTFIPTEGTVTLIQGARGRFWGTDGTGATLASTSPRSTGIQAYAGLRIQAKLFDTGDNAADANIQDLFDWDGVVGSTWTSTTTRIDTADRIHTFDCAILVADRGSVKGATWTLTDILPPDGGYSINITRDGGWLLDVELRSMNDVFWTKTRTSP